jgi:predicted N-acyltransferase
VTADPGGARLVTSAREIGSARWNALANPQDLAEPHPFTSYEFFAALEESGSASRKSGWQPAHLLAPDGLMPLYLKNHSYGEYVFDHAWAEALERAGGDYYPKLQCSVPFTPVTGRRLLTEESNRESLLKTAAGALRQIGASSLHITFLTEEEWRAAGKAGYLMRTGQQFHWENRGYDSFDQFLGELSSAKRKNLRKERASVRDAGIRFDWLTGSDITEAHWDQFFEFYMDTGSRKWGSP